MAKSGKDLGFSIKIVSPPSNSSSEKYSLLMAYRELFSAVENIPNTNVRTRVREAIVTAMNGAGESLKKKCCCVITKVDSSTQTSADDWIKSEEEAEKSTIIPVGGVVKLGRKRKILLPQATTSTNLGVKLTKRQQQKLMQEIQQTRNRQQVKSEESSEVLQKFLDDCLNPKNDKIPIDEWMNDLEKPTSLKDVEKKTTLLMILDWTLCVKKNRNGFFLLHLAVQHSDKLLVKRQCITLKNRKLGVDLRTSDGFTALHIALKYQSDDQIVEILLNYGADISQVDPAGNNCILLAAKHASSLHVFSLILKRASLDDLQKENIQSHRIFRIVVDSGRIDFLHELIKHINKCLELPTTVPEGDDQHIIRHYRKILNDFSDEKIAPNIKINEVKAKMINCPDKTAGKTPLFCAVEKQKEIIVLALLVNFADPRIETFFKKDCYALANEVLTNKRICTALDQVKTFYDILQNLEDDPGGRKRSISSSEDNEDSTKRIKI